MGLMPRLSSRDSKCMRRLSMRVNSEDRNGGRTGDLNCLKKAYSLGLLEIGSAKRNSTALML